MPDVHLQGFLSQDSFLTSDSQVDGGLEKFRAHGTFSENRYRVRKIMHQRQSLHCQDTIKSLRNFFLLEFLWGKRVV